MTFFQLAPTVTNLFSQLDIDLSQLRLEDIARIPLTPKEAVRTDPDAFVRQKAKPFFRATTTGTTGWPTSIYFSQDELRVYFALAAMSSLINGDILPEDIVQLSVSSRAGLGNLCLAGAAAQIGAVVYQTGIIEPEQGLRLLLEEHHIAGKKPRTSVLYTYPSYLGHLVEYGLQHGYMPADFGLEKVMVGGEIVTHGLKQRAERLFGPVAWSEGYGITELWPLSGTLSTDGYLHFDVSYGLIEVYNEETQAAARPGEVGTIVATPFPPFRETTLLLRYDTQDMVQVPAHQPADLPTTGPILGKRGLSVRHEHGWTFPRQIMEALEIVEDVPLPAQFGFWKAPHGVAVEVVVHSPTSDVLQRVGDALEAQGVPVQSLDLKTHARELMQPYPLRGDLREQHFKPLVPIDPDSD